MINNAVLDNINNKFADHPQTLVYCASCSSTFVVYGNCGNRYCGICRFKNYLRLLHGYSRLVSEKKPNKLITLTIKNQPILTREWVYSIKKAFSKLLRLVYYKKKIRGGIYCVECINKGKGWNLHLHSLCCADHIPRSKLSSDWCRITGDSYICDVLDVISPVTAFSYILKDLLKQPPLHGHYQEYQEVFKRFRFVSKFGDWYNIPPEPPKKGVCPNCGSDDIMSEFFIDRELRILENF